MIGAVSKIHFALIFVGMLLLTSGLLHAETPAEPLSLIVGKITEKLRQTYPEKSLEAVIDDKNYLNFAVLDMLDTRLAEEHPIIQGTTLYFTWPNSTHAASIITLTYPTHAIALQQSQLLPGFGQKDMQYLRKNKVLTPFTYVVIDNSLVVLFFENKRTFSLVKMVAEALNTNQQTPLPAP